MVSRIASSETLGSTGRNPVLPSASGMALPEPSGPAGTAASRTRTAGVGTVPALELALVWLADHQGPDGSWDPETLVNRRTGVRTSGGGRSTHRTGVTALAALAFLGHGETHKRGFRRKTVKLAAKYLKTIQDPRGQFVMYRREGRNPRQPYVRVDIPDPMLQHAWATQAMAELYALTRSPLFKQSLASAVGFLIRARTPDGGWPRVEGSRLTDTDVTLWALLALDAARVGHPDAVPEGVLEAGFDWLSSVTDAPSGLVLSTRFTRHDFDRDLWLTAGGAFARIRIAGTTDSRPVRQAVEHCLLRPPAWETGRIDIPLWHLATHTLFQRDGRAWRTWNAAMKDAVLGGQRQDGDARGSWDPIGPWAAEGGRVWSTAMLAMCLEVYYRYKRVENR
jgi:hypothetical protein